MDVWVGCISTHCSKTSLQNLVPPSIFSLFPFPDMSSIYFTLAPSSLLVSRLFRFIRPLLSHILGFPIPFLLSASALWPPFDPPRASPTFLALLPLFSDVPFIHPIFSRLILSPHSLHPSYAPFSKAISSVTLSR